MKFDYSANYTTQLEGAQEFQDFWCSYLWKNECLAIGNFGSKKYQYNVGENLQGFEFKHDKKFEITGNFWIETKERTNPNYGYVISGIFREDNSWMYCIGNYKVLYLFSKKWLQRYCNAAKVEIRENNIKTSFGFLLTKELADTYCNHKIETPEAVAENMGGTA